MADVQETKTPYELLVRFNSAGSPAGAHVKYLKTLTIDGTVVKQEETDPEAVALGNDFPLSSLFGDGAATAIAQVASLTEQVNGLTAEKQALQQDYDLEKEAHAATAAKLDLANMTIANLSADKAALVESNRALVEQANT